MRLLKRDLKPVFVFKRTEVESDYVGTEERDVFLGVVPCHISPADSKITSEVYGERANSMFSLICDKNADLGDFVSFTDESKPEYKILSKKKYYAHQTVLAERLILNETGV